MDHIPANTGKFLVGCTDFMTKKSFKPACFIPAKSDKDDSANLQEIGDDSKNQKANIPGYFMRLFYPTTPEVAKNHERAHWIAKDIYADGFTFFVHLPVLLFGGITRWILGHTRMHAYLDAPLYHEENNHISSTEDNIEKARKQFPVVVFSHGLGANRTAYSSFCTDLASKGFVVAAVEHRDQSASATYYIDDEDRTEVIVPYRRLMKQDNEFTLRNSQVQQRAHEVSMAFSILEMLNSNDEISTQNVVKSSFEFSSLKGSLNLKDVSIIGHSFGGATAINAMAKDNRFKSGIVFDAWMFPLGKEVFDNVKQPVLFVNSETFHWEHNIQLINELIGKDENKRTLTIKGTGHHSQCDIPSIVPSWLLKMFKMHASLNQNTAMKIQRKILFSFLKENIDLTLSYCCDEENDDETDSGLMDYVIDGMISK